MINKQTSSFAFVGLAISILSGCGKGESSNSGIIPIGSNTNVEQSANNGAASTNPSIDPQSGSGSKIKNLDRIYQTENLETTTIKTPGGDLKLWIMDTERKRAEGMMMLHDNEVKDNEGMIFVFPDVQKMSGNYAFWMHNTILPLDIDYISKEKKVLNVGKGVPYSEAPVKPAGDYFYVIEVKQGLSAKFGLTPGAFIDISNNLKGKP